MNRFDFDFYEQRMKPESDGGWVRYSDVEGLMDVSPEMVVMAEREFQDFIDHLPGPKKRLRIETATKFRIRYQAMLKFAIG